MKPTPQELQASFDAIESQLRISLCILGRLKKQRNSLILIHSNISSALLKLLDLSQKLGC